MVKNTLTQVLAHAYGVAHGVEEGVLEQLPCLRPALRVVQDAKLHKLAQLRVLYLLHTLGRDTLCTSMCVCVHTCTSAHCLDKGNTQSSGCDTAPVTSLPGAHLAELRHGSCMYLSPCMLMHQMHQGWNCASDTVHNVRFPSKVPPKKRQHCPTGHQCITCAT